MTQGHIVQEVTDKDILETRCQRCTTLAKPQGVADGGHGLVEIILVGRLSEDITKG